MSSYPSVGLYPASKPQFPENPNRNGLTVPEIAGLFGCSEEAVLAFIAKNGPRQEFFSMAELAARWRCSRGTVYNRLRSAGAKVLDFALPGKKGKKAIPVSVVQQIEDRKTKKMC